MLKSLRFSQSQIELLYNSKLTRYVEILLTTTRWVVVQKLQIVINYTLLSLMEIRKFLMEWNRESDKVNCETEEFFLESNYAFILFLYSSFPTLAQYEYSTIILQIQITKYSISFRLDFSPVQTPPLSNVLDLWFDLKARKRYVLCT